MSDNVTANPGSGGSVFASAGITFAGASAQLPQSSSGLLSGSSGSWTYTLLVGGAGAVTAGTQRVTLASDDPAVSQLSTLNGKVTACNTGAVVVSSSALPSGAATSAKQPALGTAGTASTDVLTVQGIAGGTALPASQSGNWSMRAQDGSGNLLTSRVTGSSRPLEIAVLDGSGNQITSFGGSGGTASNVGSAVPSTATAGGWSDGTNMQLARVFDADSGAGTQYVAGVNLRLSSSGGSVEAGTASNPLRTDPTGTTTQPVSAVSLPLPTGAATSAKQPALGTAGTASTDVLTIQGIAGATAVKVDGSATTQPISGTVTANVGTTNGLALDATLTGGSQKTKIVDSGGTNIATVSAAGAVKVDGSAVTQPVSGTVTANIGTVGTLALETGGNLATIATNTTGVNNTVGTAASAIPSKVLVVGGSDGTNARALKVNTSGQADIRPLTSSDVVSAAQSGTWTVGLSAAQTLATVTTVSTVTSLTQFNGNAIDTNSGVRSAGTLRVVLATDQPQLTNALKVDPSAVTSPVSLASVPTHAVNVAASATSSGASVYSAVSAATTNGASVKASAGQVLGLWAMNLNASPRYIKLFNKASSPTTGSDIAVAQVMIPGSTTGAGVVIQFPCPLPFSTGIAVAITGGISLTDNTSISANEVTLNIQYV